MSLRFPSADEVQDAIREALGGTKAPQMISGDFKGFLETTQAIRDFDERFRETGGKLMEIGADAKETSQNFTDIHIKQFRDRTEVNEATGEVTEIKGAPPSIPAMAMAYAEKMGIDQGTPEYKAMMMVAVRAEKAMENEPDYHNRLHFLDVAVMTANNIDANDRLVAEGKGVPLSKEDKALAFISAIGHDIGHPGGKNSITGQAPEQFDHYRLENQSIEIITPLLREAGLREDQITKVDLTIKTTSPDGPNVFKDAMVEAVRKGEDPHTVFDKPFVFLFKDQGITLGDKFPELKALADDPKLLMAAAMVGDADVYASGGAGFLSNHDMSVALTSEWDKAGVTMNNQVGGPKYDLGTDGARAFFLGAGVIGGSFASEGGQQNGNDVLTAMVDESKRRMAVDKETKELQEEIAKKEAEAPKSEAPKSAEPVTSKFVGPIPSEATPPEVRAIGPEKVEAMVQEELRRDQALKRAAEIPDTEAPTKRGMGAMAIGPEKVEAMVQDQLRQDKAMRQADAIPSTKAPTVRGPEPSAETTKSPPIFVSKMMGTAVESSEPAPLKVSAPVAAAPSSQAPTVRTKTTPSM